MNSKLNVALVAMMMTLGGTAFAQGGAPQPSEQPAASQPATESKPEASKEADKAPVKKGKMSHKHGKAKGKKVVEPSTSTSQPKVK